MTFVSPVTVARAGIVPPVPLNENVIELVPTEVITFPENPAGDGFEKLIPMFGANPVVLCTGMVMVPMRTFVVPAKVLEKGGTILILWPDGIVFDNEKAFVKFRPRRAGV
jgi:hypothetical protein